MYNYRTTIRMNSNLKNRIQFLAIKNLISFNKMVIILLELGYETFIKRYENNYKYENTKTKGVNVNEE